MAAIHKALDESNAEHQIFYEDEVDIHLYPKIGADWQRRGQQKCVVTPGQNEKYYLAGALHSGTGKVSYVGGNSKSSTLFISLLKRFKATYRRAKTITLIVDNYIIHRSRETQRWLKVQSHLSAGLLAMDESCGTAMAGTSRHNNAQSSVPLNVATAGKSSSFYRNHQPISRRQTVMTPTY